jgi:hypothetical protein
MLFDALRATASIPSSVTSSINRKIPWPDLENCPVTSGDLDTLVSLPGSAKLFLYPV